MGEPDLVVSILSDVPEINCNYFIEGETTNNAILKAIAYWRKNNITILDCVEDIDFAERIKLAKIISINIIEVTQI